MSDEIIKALVELKFTKPTEIQRVSIPVSVYGKADILGAAPTGSGKTLGKIEALQPVPKSSNANNFFSLRDSHRSKHS